MQRWRQAEVERPLIRTLGGGLAITAAMMAAGQATNKLGLLRLDFGRVLGTMLGRDRRSTRAAGWALSVANGTLMALGYDALFRWTPLWPGVTAGAAAGAAHAAGSMGFLAALAHLHPRPRQAGLRPFGPFAYGPVTVPMLLLGHVAYGATVGWWLGRVAQRDRRRSTRPRLILLPGDVGLPGAAASDRPQIITRAA